jgi:hypothetical protein
MVAEASEPPVESLEPEEGGWVGSVTGWVDAI